MSVAKEPERDRNGARARATDGNTHTQHRLDVPVIESILYYVCVYVFKTQIIGDSWMENQIGYKPSKFLLAATLLADTHSFLLSFLFFLFYPSIYFV